MGTKWMNGIKVGTKNQGQTINYKEYIALQEMGNSFKVTKLTFVKMCASKILRLKKLKDAQIRTMDNSSPCNNSRDSQRREEGKKVKSKERSEAGPTEIGIDAEG